MIGEIMDEFQRMHQEGIDNQIEYEKKKRKYERKQKLLYIGIDMIMRANTAKLIALALMESSKK